VVGIDESLARHAGDLADELALRGHDAVHLASALALGRATTFITWDVDLSAAAHESGLAVAPAM
jgi:predicted nucleic acid-binding protein